ncbi:hypothetical protein E5D57_000167 [Metarhizium anisopliae]|nr:hypothetical protein E5D57_000167 [Metarhizium anisopliae]
MKVAEWSTWSCDQIAYRNALSRAGFDHEEILPTQSHWVLPLNWMRTSQPTLPGYSLGYTCALFAPSRLVWVWHDAVADTLMLLDILTTRQMKLFEGQVELPPLDVAISRLFIPRDNTENFRSTGVRMWQADEERKCYARIEEIIQQNPYATKRSILDAVSFWLLSEGYFRTRKAISAHLVDTVSRHHGESRFTFTAKEDMNTPVRIYNELWAPRLKSTLEVIPPPTVGTPAQEIVKAAVDETKAIQALPLGSAWWAQCRRRALAGAGDVPEEEIDLALLILINSRGKSFCTLCGGEADGNHICLRCYKMKPNAHPSLCQCGEQRSKGRNMCNKCEVAVQMRRRRGYRVDLATRLGQDPSVALRCFACDGPRAVGKRLCEQCFLADNRVWQRERREHGICQDCGGPRAKYRQRCEDCSEAILKQVSPQDMRQEVNPNIGQSGMGGEKREREPGYPVPAQENAQENARDNGEGNRCGNPNCGIVLPPEGRLSPGRGQTTRNLREMEAPASRILRGSHLLKPRLRCGPTTWNGGIWGPMSKMPPVLFGPSDRETGLDVFQSDLLQSRLWHGSATGFKSNLGQMSKMLPAFLRV